MIGLRWFKSKLNIMSVIFSFSTMLIILTLDHDPSGRTGVYLIF